MNQELSINDKIKPIYEKAKNLFKIDDYGYFVLAEIETLEELEKIDFDLFHHYKSFISIVLSIAPSGFYKLKDYKHRNYHIPNMAIGNKWQNGKYKDIQVYLDEIKNTHKIKLVFKWHRWVHVPFNQITKEDM